MDQRSFDSGDRAWLSGAAHRLCRGTVPHIFRDFNKTPAAIVGLWSSLDNTNVDQRSRAQCVQCATGDWLCFVVSALTVQEQVMQTFPSICSLQASPSCSTTCFISLSLPLILPPAADRFTYSPFFDDTIIFSEQFTIFLSFKVTMKWSLVLCCIAVFLICD